VLAMNSSKAGRRVRCFTGAAIPAARLVRGVPDSPVEMNSSHAPFDVVRRVNCHRSRLQASVFSASVALHVASLTAVSAIAISATGLPRHPLHGGFGPA